MIWYSTNYFNQALVTDTSISEKSSPDRTTYLVHAVILGVTHNLGEAETHEDAQQWLDDWKAEGKKASDKAAAEKEAKQP